MRNAEIECLSRLQELVVGIDDIMSFFLEEQLMTNLQVKEVRSAAFSAKVLHSLIAGLRKEQLVKLNNSIQLIEYQWHILPVERIKITIVTDRTTKEFSYNFF